MRSRYATLFITIFTILGLLVTGDVSAQSVSDPESYLFENRSGDIILTAHWEFTQRGDSILFAKGFVEAASEDADVAQTGELRDEYTDVLGVNYVGMIGMGRGNDVEGIVFVIADRMDVYAIAYISSNPNRIEEDVIMDYMEDVVTFGPEEAEPYGFDPRASPDDDFEL